MPLKQSTTRYKQKEKYSETSIKWKPLVHCKKCSLYRDVYFTEIPSENKYLAKI